VIEWKLTRTAMTNHRVFDSHSHTDTVAHNAGLQTVVSHAHI